VLPFFLNTLKRIKKKTMKYVAKFMLMLLLVGFNSAACKEAQKVDSSLITPDQLVSMKNDIVLIDVRTPEEYAAGHLENAVNINLYDDDFKSQLEAIDKSKAVAVYCKVGGRSAKAADIIKEIGFTEVYDLEGGILNWEEKGMKTVK